MSVQNTYIKIKILKLSFPEVQAGGFRDTVKQHILYPT